MPYDFWRNPFPVFREAVRGGNVFFAGSDVELTTRKGQRAEPATASCPGMVKGHQPFHGIRKDLPRHEPVEEEGFHQFITEMMGDAPAKVNGKFPHCPVLQDIPFHKQCELMKDDLSDGRFVPVGVHEA